MADPAFWGDQAGAQKVMQRRKRVESDLELLKSLRTQEDDARVLLDWLEAGEDVAKDLPPALDALEATIEAAEFQKMLGGEHDRANAILTINSGAGGTDSQDWAEMLLRMYLRWCDRRGFKRDLIDIQAGEEAGIKSATVIVHGEYAFGYLSAEAGVHRLVRISPFDSNARRQTSFASVFAWPEIDDDDRDRRPGQGPARRHLPLERGRRPARQRDRLGRAPHAPAERASWWPARTSAARSATARSAMKILKSRLYELEMSKRREKLDAVEAAKKQIAFGSQIRSYVLHPYRMVKDHAHEARDRQRRPRARRRHRRLHQGDAGREGPRHAGRGGGGGGVAAASGLGG